MNNKGSTSPETISIIIVDDHSLFREGVSLTLNGDSNICVVAEGGSAEDAIHLTQKFMPDILLLDISMPGSGINAAKVISTVCPVVKIVMLTVSEHDEDVVSSLQNGAQGYILKGISGTELVTIVKDIHQGGSYVSPGLAAKLLSDSVKTTTNVFSPDNDIFSDLSAREEQILRLISKGLSNKEIGAELGIAEKTVKHYVTNILQKLHVRNRVEAAMLVK